MHHVVGFIIAHRTDPKHVPDVHTERPQNILGVRVKEEAPGLGVEVGLWNVPISMNVAPKNMFLASRKTERYGSSKASLSGDRWET